MRRIAENTHKLEKLGNLAELVTHLNANSNGLRKLERIDTMLNKAKGACTSTGCPVCEQSGRDVVLACELTRTGRLERGGAGGEAARGGGEG